MLSRAKMVVLMAAAMGVNIQDTPLLLTYTTTGAFTAQIDALTIAAGKTVVVDWGDGSSNAYTGNGTRTHNYAGAGVWAVKLSNRRDITRLELADDKFTGTINAANPMPAGLTILTLYITKLTWVINAAAPMPATLLNLNLTVNANVSWTVSASSPMPTGLTSLTLSSPTAVTWACNSSNPLPVGLITLYISDASNVSVAADQWQRINAIRTLRVENYLTSAVMDATLGAIWANKANYTYATPALDLLGVANQAPGGVFQAATPPTTGKEFAYDLVNGTFTSAGPEWTVAIP